MEVKLFINGTDVSEYVILKDTSISHELTNRAASASFTLSSLPATGGDIFPLPIPFNLSGEMDLKNMLEVVIEDLDSNSLFSGFITGVNYSPQLPDHVFYKVTCVGWLKLLENYEVTLDYTSSITDQQIIRDMFDEHLPDFDTDEVQALNTFSEFKMTGTMRQVLDALCSYAANTEFFIDADKRLYFDDTGYTLAPFQLGPSDVAPSNLTYQSDFSDRANRVVAKGVDIVTNEPFTVTADDEDSQAQWGAIFPFYASDSFASRALAEVYADAELSRRSQPKESAACVIYTHGLAPGQYVSVTDPRLKLNGKQMIVRSVSQKWLSESLCEYSISLGAYKQELPEFLRSISNTASKANQPRGSVISPGSVTGGMLADAVLSQLRHFGPALRPVVMLSSNPSLPDADFPPDATIYNTSDSKFYKNDAGTWEETDGPVGSYLTYHVGAFNAQTMIGAIVAEQIESVNVTTLVGEINSAAGVVVNANSIVGTMPGTVTIQGGSIQALFNSGSTVSIHGSLLTNNTVPGNAVISISGSQIQNLSITGTKLENGTITDTQIGSMSVSKLTASTVYFGSATTFGYNSDYTLSLQSNQVKLAAHTTRYFSATSTAVNIVNGDRLISLSDGAINLTFNSETKATLSGSGLKLERGSSTLDMTASGIIISGASGGPSVNLSSSNLLIQNGSGHYTAIGSGGIIINSSAGIGIGSTSISTSPVQITSSMVQFYWSGTRRFRLEAGGIANWQVNTGTYINLVDSTSSIVLNANGGVSTSFMTVNGNLNVASGEYRVDGVKVLGTRQAPIADATDASDLLNKFNWLLGRLRTHGIIGT